MIKSYHNLHGKKLTTIFMLKTYRNKIFNIQFIFKLVHFYKKILSLSDSSLENAHFIEYTCEGMSMRLIAENVFYESYLISYDTESNCKKYFLNIILIFFSLWWSYNQ